MTILANRYNDQSRGEQYRKYSFFIHKRVTHRCADKSWGCYIYLAGVDQLADLLSCFLRRRGKDMAVDIHSSGDVLVAQTFLC